MQKRHITSFSSYQSIYLIKINVKNNNNNNNNNNNKDNNNKDSNNEKINKQN